MNLTWKKGKKRGSMCKVKLIVQNASGTQALTLRGLSNPGVLRLGVVYRESVQNSPPYV